MKGLRQSGGVKNIRALTFDLDDTLWDNRPVLLAAEQTLYDWLSIHYPRITDRYTLVAMREMRMRLVLQQPDLGHNMTELRKTSLRLAADSVGYDHQLVEPAFAVFIEARHQINLFDDVLPVLQRLKQAGYRIGSMTNGNADVNRLGLGHVFDFSLTAESVGIGKPHPLMFEVACRHAEVSPKQLAHVGDDPATDLLGGRTAGVKTIWMNRHGAPKTEGLTMDAEIASMSDLLPLFRLV
ncbi:MAG: HAD family hydrolase [Gammaproteobacteria bacterium]|nr:HAD family hydrolase [Gammaproteobacteria bacterium]